MQEARHDIAIGDLPPFETVKCGNRTDWPKKSRVHDWTILGRDVRRGGSDGVPIEGIVSACMVCGTDTFHKMKEKA